MPAGDLITAAGDVLAAELQGVLVGGTGAVIAPPGIGGVGEPTPKSQDVALNHADGAYGGPDYRSPKVITVPILIEEPTAAAAMAVFDTLMTAWAPTTTDVELHLRLPGWGHVKYLGRPRGLAEDFSLMPEGVINCMGTFVALSPARLSAFVPTSIAGLVLWAEGDAITGLADGAAVGSWNDASGGARHLLQATAGKKPAYKIGILNGKPVVRFATAVDDDSLASAAFTALSLPLTVFVVTKVAASTGGYQTFLGADSVAGSNATLARNTAGNLEGNGGAGAAVGGAMTIGTWYIAQSLWTASAAQVRLAGGAKTQTSHGAISTTFNKFNAAEESTGVAELDGDIAAIIVYNADLTLAQLDQVGGYLATKYALPWAPST